MNNISLIGRLTADPELKYVNDDNALCNFRIAVSRNYKNKDGIIPTDFINIDLWGKRAEIFCQYATKGSLIGINGSLRINESQNRTFVAVHADNFYFLGHKNKTSQNSKVFEGENLFENVLGDDEVSEEELPF